MVQFCIAQADDAVPVVINCTGRLVCFQDDMCLCTQQHSMLSAVLLHLKKQTRHNVAISVPLQRQ